MVTSFKYLGRVISVADEDWLAVVKNLYRAMVVCRRMPRVLRREGAAPQVSGLIFKVVVQAVFNLLILATKELTNVVSIV